MQDEVLGVSTCPTCKKRFRILKKHASFIGKQIQCPKCHRPFVVEVQVPSPIEQAAIANAAAASNGAIAAAVAVSASADATSADSSSTAAVADAPQEKAKRRVRTKAQIRKAQYKHIREEFRPFLRRLKAIAGAEGSSEEEVRRWCIDVLRTVLGYDDGDLDTEMAALGQRIDIAIKHDGKVISIVECKNVRHKLPQSARDQAVMYAANKSADWAVLTNGQDWALYRIIPVKGHDPRVVEVFNISLLDDDGLSDWDVERMYLLTKRALLRGESEKEFHLVQCLDNRRMLLALTSERVIRSARRHLMQSYKKETGEIVRLTAEDVREQLKELTRPSEL